MPEPRALQERAEHPELGELGRGAHGHRGGERPTLRALGPLPPGPRDGWRRRAADDEPRLLKPGELHEAQPGGALEVPGGRPRGADARVSDHSYSIAPIKKEDFIGYL